METDFGILYLENQLCFPLYATSRLTIQLYEPHLKELDITYPQYLVLMVLWQNNHLSVNEIGEKLLLESNTLTPLLKRMEQKSLIIRQRNAQDERKVLVSLTKIGEDLKLKAVSIPEKIIASVADNSISNEEITSFKNTLNKLLNLLKANS